MSNTQDELISRQRQMQQRQILALMGIEQWVRPDSPTIDMVSIAHGYEESPQLTAQQPAAVQSIDDTNVLGVDDIDISHLNSNSLDIIDLQSDSLQNEIAPTQSNLAKEAPITTDAQKNDIKQNSIKQVAQALEPLVEQLSVQDNADTKAKSSADQDSDKIAPFDLQGGRYGNWVLLVDIQALNNDSQKLWQNITQALSINCETTSFPICAGMDTAELANASLAGYIFKIGRSEEVQVAALTDLPNGLLHPNLVGAPLLDEMLGDANLKRQFWQQLSS